MSGERLPAELRGFDVWNNQVFPRKMWARDPTRGETLIARTVGCPRCGARRGGHCRSATGLEITVHVERYSAARRLGPPLTERPQ